MGRYGENATTVVTAVEKLFVLETTNMQLASPLLTIQIHHPHLLLLSHSVSSVMMLKLLLWLRMEKIVLHHHHYLTKSVIRTTIGRPRNFVAKVATMLGMDILGIFVAVVVVGRETCVGALPKWAVW